MDWFTGIIVYLLIWWTALFTVLPWGVERSNVCVEEGIKAAPKNPKMKKKLIATTILSAVLWIVVYALIEADIIDFRELAKTMAEQDGVL